MVKRKSLTSSRLSVNRSSQEPLCAACQTGRVWACVMPPWHRPRKSTQHTSLNLHPKYKYDVCLPCKETLPATKECDLHRSSFAPRVPLDTPSKANKNKYARSGLYSRETFILLNYPKTESYKRKGIFLQQCATCEPGKSWKIFPWDLRQSLVKTAGYRGLAFEISNDFPPGM